MRAPPNPRCGITMRASFKVSGKPVADVEHGGWVACPIVEAVLEARAAGRKGR